MRKKRKKRIAIYMAIVAVCIAILFYAQNQRKNKVDRATEALTEEELASEQPMIFGFPADSFIVENYKVQKNQNLSDILSKQNVDYTTLVKLLDSSKDIFDVRKMIVGNDYYFLKSIDDSTTHAKYFVYEKNKIDYVVFQLNDSLITYQGQKEVRQELKYTSGIITSSLWNSLIDCGASPVLAVELSDIYAWTIDFFGIQKGDSYKVIYEESFVDSISIGINIIYAAEFNHMEKPYFAFRFEQDSTINYFNENGESLKKAFLKAPLNYKRVSSGFSNSRYHPVLKIYRPHHGVDYAAAVGTPVMTIGDGTVIKKSYQRGGAGYYLKIKHNTVYTTTYMHLQSFAKGIAEGRRVRQGEVIGYVGSTGVSTGPHLDFRVQKNGAYINPLKMESPPTHPVNKDNMPEYKTHRDSLMIELKQIDIPTGNTQNIY